MAAGDADGDELVDVFVGAGINNTGNAAYNSLVHMFDNASLIHAPTTVVAPDLP